MPIQLAWLHAWDFSPRTRRPIKPGPVLALTPATMLLLSLTLSLVLLGSSWGEWAWTSPGSQHSPGFPPRGSGGSQAGWKGSRWTE